MQNKMVINKSFLQLVRLKFLSGFMVMLGVFCPIAGAEKMGTSIENLRTSVANTLNGWQLQEQTVYDSSSLYEYINGGAELYLSYGFKRLLNLRYENPGQPDIFVDIFDMEDSRQAFGVFSHSRELIDSTFGQGSQYTAGLLLFWKDKFYISILASPETDSSKQAVFHLASLIDNQINETGVLPDLLEKLPLKGLVTESIRYFNHPLWINTYYYLTEDNIFLLGKNTWAALAKYSDSGFLLLVEYPTIVAAKSVFKQFRQSMMPENPPGNSLQIEDGSWIAGKQSGNFVIVVFNSPSAERADVLVKAVEKSL
jgi:hypothetical protein